MSALKIILAAGIYICFVVILIFYIVKFRNKTRKIDNQIEKEKEEILFSSLEKEYETLKEKSQEKLRQYEEEERKKINEKLKEIQQYCEEIISKEVNTKKNQEEIDCQKEIQLIKEEYELKKLDLQSEIIDIEKNYEKLKNQVDNATLAAKREEEKKNNIKFYQVNLSQEDKEDIEKLKEIEKKLSRPDVLNKLIYKVYLEKPTTDLVNRVIGPDSVTGIYKITNTVNQMTYVGQSVDLKARWRQHIKRGIGAETPLKNKLYPAMEEFGVWNFTFEVIEICKKEELNEREQFWQEYFNAKTYGYSIK